MLAGIECNSFLRWLEQALHALAACCGFDLSHKDILYLYLYSFAFNMLHVAAAATSAKAKDAVGWVENPMARARARPIEPQGHAVSSSGASHSPGLPKGSSAAAVTVGVAAVAHGAASAPAAAAAGHVDGAPMPDPAAVSVAPAGASQVSDATPDTGGAEAAFITVHPEVFHGVAAASLAHEGAATDTLSARGAVADAAAAAAVAPPSAELAGSVPGQLPQWWVERVLDGAPYYVCFATRESRWTRPDDADVVVAPSDVEAAQGAHGGWLEVAEPEGAHRSFFVNVVTKTAEWIRPQELSSGVANV